VRFIGVTGHHDPLITRRCIELFDFDTVLIPVNPAESFYKSYLDTVIPPASRKGMGIIAMKVYFRGFASRIPGYSGMGPFFRFALSQPVTTAVIGCDSIQQLEENASFASSYTAMSQEEQDELSEFVAPHARQLMYYKPVTSDE
jgi:predicted aldo/keto reductase-like oxidoreductase